MLEPAAAVSPDNASRHLHRAATTPGYSTSVGGGPALPSAAPAPSTSGHTSARVSVDGRFSQPHCRVSVNNGPTAAMGASASSASLAGAGAAGLVSTATVLRRQAALGEAAERWAGWRHVALDACRGHAIGLWGQRALRTQARVLVFTASGNPGVTRVDCRAQSSNDGVLEVIMITGAVQLGQLTVRAGVRRAA